MKLITEMTEDVNYLSEEKKDGGKRLYIEGVIMQHSIKNRNGRVYPREVMMKEVERYITEKVETNAAYGELGHPNNPQITAENICHRFVSLKEEGNNIVGKALVSSHGKGLIVEGIINDGGRLGISSRGMGSLKEKNGVMEVQSDYILNTAGDIVIDPSAPDAYINGVLEGKEWVWENGILVEHEVANHEKMIKSATRVDLEEKMLTVFGDFLSKIRR